MCVNKFKISSKKYVFTKNLNVFYLGRIMGMALPLARCTFNVSSFDQHFSEVAYALGTCPPLVVLFEKGLLGLCVGVAASTIEGFHCTLDLAELLLLPIGMVPSPGTTSQGLQRLKTALTRLVCVTT